MLRKDVFYDILNATRQMKKIKRIGIIKL